MKRFFKTSTNVMLKVSEISGYESDAYIYEEVPYHSVIIHMASGLKVTYCQPHQDAVKQELYRIEHALTEWWGTL